MSVLWHPLIFMSRESDFDNIFRTYYEQMLRFVHQFVADSDDCHDIVTAVFEDVWRNFPTIDISTIQPYLYKTSRNHVIDFLRHDVKRQRYAEYAMRMTAHSEDPEYAAERKHNQLVIEDILKRIGPPTSDILKACYIDGKKYQEVAEEMEMSLASVKKHMVKALKMVREMKKSLKR